ncbi:MAG: phosphatidylglycerophosphatase A [Xanthomonadales bacterium]|nr:phosphatidylglycerophosphatase A [Xanthomonadales bacterium]
MSPATLALTVGGLGFLRPGPGTWGSVPPVLLIAALIQAGASTVNMVTALVLVCVVFSTLCVGLGSYAEQRFGRKDASEVVADETAGVCLPLFVAVGLGAAMTDLVLAFVLFRIFDISKPPPMRHLERIPGGWGVLIDDLMAGIYAAGVLALVLHLIS